MAGVYRPRHPERAVLYRVLFHYFDRFLAEYESRFEKEHGFLRPIIKEVAERYLDCGNPRCGFARIRCPDCHAERLLMFSCRARGFCPPARMYDSIFHRIFRPQFPQAWPMRSIPKTPILNLFRICGVYKNVEIIFKQTSEPNFLPYRSLP